MKFAKEFRKKMTQMLQDNPDKTQFGIIFLSGHGMITNGKQTILLNEYCDDSEFYKLYKIE